MSEPTDLDLYLSDIVAGDADAFGRWVAGAEPALRASLRSFATRVDVESVLQESLLRTWQVAPRFQRDGRPNGLLRMSHRIARNLAISELRRQRAEPVDPRVLEADDAASITPALPDPGLRNAVLDCMGELPSKPASALHARLETGGALPDQTLAEQLGMRLNTFLQNFTRARKLLLACLQGRGVTLTGESP